MLYICPYVTLWKHAVLKVFNIAIFMAFFTKIMVKVLDSNINLNLNLPEHCCKTWKLSCKYKSKIQNVKPDNV